jgi:hypothetical protein
MTTPSNPATEIERLIADARAAITTFRDAARQGVEIGFRQRDPLVMTLHRALDALTAEREARQQAERERDALQVRLDGWDYTDAPKLRKQLERWEGNGGLVQAVRELRGFSEDWPDHGNAPLAIAASYALLVSKLTASEQSRETLRTALAKLRKEIAGTLAIAERDIRDAIGSTNVACIKLRLAEADAALAASQPAGMTTKPDA